MPRVRGAVIAAAGCVIALAGCGSSDSTRTSAGSQQPAAANAPRPTVRFVTPKQDATFSGAVKAKVALTNFQIAPQAVGQAPRPGQGHLHFRMDGGKFDYPKYSGPNGLIAKKLDVTGHYSPALSPVITYKHLPPGKHKLEVYLANNNHTNVGIEAEVAFVER
jgi:hypothetical protein